MPHTLRSDWVFEENVTLLPPPTFEPSFPLLFFSYFIRFSTKVF